MAIIDNKNYKITGEEVKDLASRVGANTTLAEAADAKAVEAKTIAQSKQNALTAGFNITISEDIISATDTTYSDFTGATASTAGVAGLVPAPAAGDESKVLKADGTWAVPEGGIKTLTTADYNWPTTGTKTAIALWLLPDGIYDCSASGIVVRASTESLVSGGHAYVTSIDSSSKLIRYFNGSVYLQRKVNSQNGANEGLIIEESPVANLTSTSSARPLAASQGNELNNKIEGRLKTNAGAPTTSTTGTKGQLLEDTTNGNLYICTNSASPYAWKQIDKDEILTNAGAPTTSTAGTLGQLLTDTTNAKLYQLTAIDNTDPQNPSYTWSEVGGSSGPTVVQTTGTSQTDVMSQNAVTSMVYADPLTQRRVQIGAGASAHAQNGISIGYNANGTNLTIDNRNSVAIGNGTYAGARCVSVGLNAATSTAASGAVAIGAASNATVTGQFDIGSTDTSYGYNSSNYRLLTGLYDPQSAHDAATKGYADTKATITMTTTDPGEGAVLAANHFIAVYQ